MTGNTNFAGRALLPIVFCSLPACEHAPPRRLHTRARRRPPASTPADSPPTPRRPPAHCTCAASAASLFERQVLPFPPTLHMRALFSISVIAFASAFTDFVAPGDRQVTFAPHSDAAQALHGGSGGWSCEAPLEATDCVLSSWHGWKGDRDKFQAKCKGNLVRWGDDSGVQDCGVACFACSYIRACCDTCKTILAVEGSYVPLGCTSVPKEVSQTTGVTVSTSSSWSRTDEWSSSVSSKVAASGIVEGIDGSVELSAETKQGLSMTMSSSWSKY